MAKARRSPSMTLAQFITANEAQIIAEWEEFARSCEPAASTMNLADRRDHVDAMLKSIAIDMNTEQTSGEQADKSRGTEDAPVNSQASSNSHGSDRAALGYTPAQMVAEFRALRASVLRLWSKAQAGHTHASLAASLEELSRFNEAIDQLLAESITRFSQEVEDSKELFLGVIGHDLRNPLGAIMMCASELVNEAQPESVNARLASRILISCTRMERIVSDLMDVTRSRLGDGIPIRRVEMDMEAVCRHTANELSAFHPGCVVNVTAKGQLTGQWDSGRIGQLVSNLVGNAYQHGSEEVPIALEVRGEADRVVLKVHNEGAMIPKSALQDIFNPFRQLKPSQGKAKAMGSVGLGLYIAKAIAAAHDGTIEVKSTRAGTTFTVRLPRQARSVAPPE